MVTLDFALAASIYFMMLIAIAAGGNFFWTHNALVEATRRGARYATIHLNTATDADVKNVVVYGTPTPAAGASPFINNLENTNVIVQHSFNAADTTKNFGVGKGTVSVSITGYEYDFVIPGINRTIQMPPYRTTLSGESAGYVPVDK